MGIKFTCPACGGTLNVKSELAGKRGRCPKCQAKITIPLEDAANGEAAPAPPAAAAAPASSSSEPAVIPAPEAAITPGPAVAAVAPQPAIVVPGAVDPIVEAPTLQWYAVPAVPPGAASQYGPASGEEFRVWLQEGRITADALVWRQDWADWLRAGTVFPQLESPPAAGAAIPAVAPVAALAVGSTPLPTAAAAMPMMVGGPPVAQAAFPMAPAMTGPFPTVAAVPSDAFPIAADEPTTKRADTGRGRAYRQRSNTGPIIAIVVLLLAMIPLSYLVYKVVQDQISSAPAETATGPKDTK